MKLLLRLLVLTALLAGAWLLVPAAEVFADTKSEICEGVTAVSGGQCDDGTSDLNRVIEVGLNLLSVIIGIIAVVMIMVGGFKYITAGGDSGNITSAKHTIIYAVIGLVVVALAQFIVQFVLDKIT
ncbi:MAG: pilin [Candidatus Saccharimonadales bacterium]